MAGEKCGALCGGEDLVEGEGVWRDIRGEELNPCEIKVSVRLTMFEMALCVKRESLPALSVRWPMTGQGCFSS